MKRPVSLEEKRYRRHLSKARQTGAWCALCEQDVTAGRALEWCDPLHPERGTVLFVLCHPCDKTNYAEALNVKHRQTWRRRHGAAPPASSDNLLLKEAP